MSDLEKKLRNILKKNCLTCKYLEVDWDDREYSSVEYFQCSKRDDFQDARSEKMYDEKGNETAYLKRSKKCHEFATKISFNGIHYSDAKDVVK